MNQHFTCLTEVEWREVGDDETTEEYWPRNSTCPAQSEVRWASIESDNRLPDDAVRVGQKCWLLFEPGSAIFNGYDQDTNPEELDACALVEVEILTALLPRQHRTWIEVCCHQVIPLADIPNVFPAIPPLAKRAGNLSATVGRTITRYQTRTQGEHEWYMVTNASTSQHALPHLVLAGFSMDSYCTICNWVVEVGKDYWKAA